ncbi:hypothetical protein MMC13_001641 [Lambiella insularis]|nr:hypothetical protein [Lambiella insularis]
MPTAEADLDASLNTSPEPLTQLPFPPVTRNHILHCSYSFWYPLYRSLTPKARLVPLPAPFLAYLRADGIVLPSSAPPSPYKDIDDDSGIFTSSSTSDTDTDDESPDPSLAWPGVHASIRDTIAELQGSVTPKLNWSAPKDATWISATNSMECRTPNDVYLLLKSSDFIAHDLEQAFDGCVEDTITSSPNVSSFRNQLSRETSDSTDGSIPYCLVLRKTIPALVTSLEFRCFVRRRRLLSICQRDLNHYAFLPSLISTLQDLIRNFFEQKLRDSFPDENFVFDVYVPQPKEVGRVWLIDINPWAIRTDPLLFSWLELLTMPDPVIYKDEIRISFSGPSLSSSDIDSLALTPGVGDDSEPLFVDESESDSEDCDEVEFRIVKRDDPEAYSFNTPQYGAHKLPKDVVDAGMGGDAGLTEFMGRWRDIVSMQNAGGGDSDGEDS